ncbi:hypothetical protein ACFU6I_25285 [Streptomyces sp. NPDC057486]|uniref:hypothetical protein n=1 Tax=Streptomyces sp. NPDC057486 TaxID=3346145 RepID=UPI0036817350
MACAPPQFGHRSAQVRRAERAAQERAASATVARSCNGRCPHHDGAPAARRGPQNLAVACSYTEADTLAASERRHGEDRGLPPRYLCPIDRRGICTDVGEDGLKLLIEVRPTSDAALRETLDEAARTPEPASLVTAVEAVDASRRR